MPVPGAYEPELEFSDPARVRESALFSFNPLVYLYFMLAFLIVPYPLYWYVARRYRWELADKSLARHWSDMMLGFSYGTILFVFGNYTHAFSWVNVVAFYPSLFGYALIAELPFTKYSLPNMNQWPFGMWAVFLTAVLVILAFAAFHIYLAAILPLPFVIYYVCALLIPAFLFSVALFLIRENNENWIRTRIHRIRVSLASSRATSMTAPVKEEEDATPQGEAGDQQPAASPAEHTALVIPDPPSPYTKTLSLHLHHWQIFYLLAFFTRFSHPVSQVGSGIVLACYMEGICAYGYDQLLND